MQIEGRYKVWKEKGLYHRLDGPAVETEDGGYRAWWVKGKLHRLDGPAIEWDNVCTEWWVDGKRHRIGGPAVDYINNFKVWWKDGKTHRLDGPAIEYIDGSKEWWINGEKMDQKEFPLYVCVYNRLQKILPVCRALGITPGKFLRLRRLCREPAVVEWFYAPNNTGGKMIKQRGMRSLQQIVK